MGAAHDKSNLRFGQLQVIIIDMCRPKSSWLCRCDCGAYTSVKGCHLVTGHTISCGCANRHDGLKTHGMCYTPTFSSWISMRRRCYDPNMPGYPAYGGSGITVCKEWQDSFEAFFAHMGERPAGTSLDRIDNDGNYEPGNCRWATRLVQNRNRRNSVENGTSLPQKCADRGVSFSKFSYHYYRKGLSVEGALEAAALVAQ